MAKYQIETSTGSVYYIDKDRNVWAKNGGWFYPLEYIAVGDWDGTRTNVPNFMDWPAVDLPEVGRNMYITGRSYSNWYLTTPIVSVKEVDDWEIDIE